MDLTQLRYFKKLATLEHLTRAAEELYISQSTLSMSISRLESELEVSLFDRIGRGIRLNAFGKAFLEEAVEALVHIDRGISLMQTMKRQEQSRVRIITPTIVGFPGLMSEIEKACEDVRIASYQCPLSDIVPHFLNGDVDLCIVAMDLSDAILDGCILRQQEMGCVLPASHPLAKQECVTVSQIADLEFVAYPLGSTQRVLFMNLFQNKGFTPRVIYESNNYYELIRAVCINNSAATVVRDMYNNYRTEDTSFVRIVDSDVDASLRLYWLKERHGEQDRPIIHAVRDVIRKHFASLSAAEEARA